MTLSRFAARVLAEGFPDDPDAARRELELAYERIEDPADDPTTGEND